jgi:putative hemolysin
MLPALTPVLRVLDALFGPILAFSSRVARRVAPAASAAVPAEPDALEDLLREAEAEGIGEVGESEIISGVVEFGEKRVHHVMTPRDRVTFVTTDAAAADVAATVAKSNYTRIPVFERDLGRVAGVLHAFDVLVNPSNPLGTMRAVAVAAPDEPCSALMRRMLRDHRHMAVVQDGTRVTGIVTLEDLVEELVGDIQDEHDEPGPAA